MYRPLISLAISALTMLCACGSSDNNKEAAYRENVPTEDKEVYALGARDAERMLSNCATITEIEQELLDVRARIHNIDSKISPQAAVDYTNGFEAYIKEHNDTLARRLGL